MTQLRYSIGSYGTRQLRTNQTVNKRDRDKQTITLFDQQVSHFKWVATQAMNISKNITVHIAEPRKGYSTWLFMRVCVTSNSLIRLFNEQVENSARYIDHASIAAVGRALIENITALIHFTDNDISEEQWRCRKALIDLHDFIHRREMLIQLGNDDPDPNGKSLADLQRKLNANPEFSQLPVDRQRRLLKGDDMFLYGRHQAMLAFGWGDAVTRGVYKYLSSHAHTTPLAFSRIGLNKVYDPHCTASKFTAAFAIEFSAKALGTACIHMLSLFPYVEASFTPLVLDSLKSQHRRPEQVDRARRAD